MSNLKVQQHKDIDLEKEFEDIRELMSAYNKAQVGMFKDEEERVEDLSTLISRAINKLNFLEERIGNTEQDLKSLALQIDSLESAIKLATSGR